MLLNSNSSYMYHSCAVLSWLKFVPGIIIDSNPGGALLYNRQMKQNNSNVSDFAEKIASVDGPETEMIIKCEIPRIEVILRVEQQQ